MGVDNDDDNDRSAAQQPQPASHEHHPADNALPLDAPDEEEVVVEEVVVEEVVVEEAYYDGAADEAETEAAAGGEEEEEEEEPTRGTAGQPHHHRVNMNPDDIPRAAAAADDDDDDPDHHHHDHDRATLARHGLLCDDDTEAMLAEVAGTLHAGDHHRGGGGEGDDGGRQQEQEPLVSPANKSKKRKANDLAEAANLGEDGNGSQTDKDQHGISAGNHHHESTTYDNHEDGEPLGSVENDHHDDDDDDVFDDEDHDEHGDHHSLLDAPGGEVDASASSPNNTDAIVAAAAVAAAALAASTPLSEPPAASSSPSTSPPKGRASMTTGRKPAPPRVSWRDRVDQLKSYKDEHGDLLIPIRYKKNPSLGKFVHNTREQFKLFHKRAPASYKKKCSLTEERIAQLDEIGFVWATERSKKQDEDWNARLEQLKLYREAHGDCLVPHGYKVDPSFAEWVHRQRTTYAIHLKEGRVNPMVEGRMKKLEEMGFNFRVHVDKWTEHYEQLQDYCRQNGNCLVPTHYSSNMKLGRWVHTQRHQYRLMQRGRKSSMTKERAKQLEELGFNWEVRPGVDRPRMSWHQRYSELEKFVKSNGHFNISPVENAPLYAWCSEQLQRLKAISEQTDRGEGSSEVKVKGMGHDRIKSLADIGFTKDVQLTPVVCEAGAAAVAAETAARELDGHSSHDEDEDDGDHDHHMHHDGDDEEGSHRDEGVDGFNEAAKAEDANAALTIIHDENQGVSVEV